MTTIPDDPFALLPHSPLNVTARVELELFGARAELICLPDRGVRVGAPGARAVFQPNRADEIIQRESVWEAPGMALTPNRFPFADRHAVLWCTERRWHPSLEMLEVGFAMEDTVAGTSIVNSTWPDRLQLYASPSLLIFSFFFSTFLGISGGLYPATWAMKLSPMEAIRRG